jgi:hypothetical protein
LRNLRYFKTATSEAVVYFGGPAMGNGIFATISLPSSLHKSSALLNPPSIFSIARTGEYFCPPVDAATSQSRSTSNVTYLRSHACFSLARNRPLVYLNKSSRFMGLPATFQRRRGIWVERLLSLPRQVMASVREGCLNATRSLLRRSLRLIALSESANNMAIFPPLDSTCILGKTQT